MDIASKIVKAVEHIDVNLDSTLSSEEISCVAHMSIRSLQRNFTSVTGLSVQNYVRGRRLTEASNEMLINNTSILDAAIKYQFDSYEGFSRAFKKNYLMSPKAYKKIDCAYNALHRNKINKELIALSRKVNIFEPEYLIQLPKRHFTGIKTSQADFSFCTDENKIISSFAKHKVRDLISNNHKINSNEEWSISYRLDKNTPFHFLEKMYCFENNALHFPQNDFDSVNIPQCHYAVFKHHKKLSRNTLVENAFSWLKKSLFYLGDSPCMYRNFYDKNKINELYIPIYSMKIDSPRWWQGYSTSIK